MKHHPAYGTAVLAVALLILASLPCSAVVYVKADSPGPAFDGDSWETAYHHIQEAIDDAEVNHEEVWVAKGLYPGCIVVKPWVKLYGGFVGTETSLGQRDARANETTLDGGGKGPVVMLSQGPPQRLDGFTIRGGNGGSKVGGAVYCNGSRSVIANNIICDNEAYYGAGIQCSNMPSGAAITGNIIARNRSSKSGGVIYCYSVTGLLISNNTIIDNTWAAIYSTGTAAPTVANNIIAFNTQGTFGTLILRNNCIYNPGGVETVGLPNFAADPGFVSLEFGDFHLRPDSPCVGAGDDSVVPSGSIDMDGQPRIQGAHVDIGADESDGIARTATPRIVKVSPTGDDSHNGYTWQYPKRTVQAAIDAYAPAPTEVWVAAGVYTEQIILRRYAHLYGGFAGTESARSERDWKANETILDGDARGSVVSCSYIGYHTSTTDGFTIRNGTNAGVYCIDASPVIANNKITGNTAPTYGGGIFCGSSSPTITGNVISGNSAVSTSSAYGGGICCLSSSPMIIANSISDNSALRGGAVYCDKSYPTISGNMITANTSTSGSGGILCASSGATIGGNVIAGNIGASGAGAVDCSSSSTSITGNTIVGSAIGIACSGSSTTISNNIVAFNARGITGYKPYPVLRNNCFYGNTGGNYSGVVPGTGDIYADPLFTDRANGDYHLDLLSPCIDAGWSGAPGMPAVDMDGEARITGPAVDIGADEFVVPVARIVRDARRYAVSSMAALRGVAVSAAFPDSFYVEADDRSAGIRVSKADHGMHAGDRVDITGSIGVRENGEKCIEALSVTPSGVSSVAPLGLVGTLIGGGNWLHDALTGAGQQGVKEYRLVRDGEASALVLMDAAGLNNIGLLVKVWGTVTYAGDGFFYLDDGSHLDDGSGHIGIKVALESQPMPEADSRVQVTGVSSCYKVGSDLFRLLRAVEITPISR